MRVATTDPRSVDSGLVNGRWPARAIPPGPGRATRGTVHDVVLIVGVFVCEVCAVLLISLQRRPVLGLLFVGAGLAIAFDWSRKHRRRADAVARDDIEAAKRLLADGSHTAAWNAACCSIALIAVSVTSQICRARSPAESPASAMPASAAMAACRSLVVNSS